MFNEIIVVEGKNDESKLKSIFPEIECFTTNGSAVDEVMPNLIELSKTRDLILFLDPDFPGEKIRQAIMQKIDCKQAFILKKDAISKNNKKVGIEHASRKAIVEALNNILTPVKIKKNEIKLIDLYNLNLIGNPKSSYLRDIICEHFRIGKCNSKKLLNRLNMYQISINEIKGYLKEINSSELK